MQPAAATRHPLPPRLIVLFDSLANVDFMSLTKRSLKDKVENLKNAVAAELAKRSRTDGTSSSSQLHSAHSSPIPETYSPEPIRSVSKQFAINSRAADKRREPLDKGQSSRPSQHSVTKNSGLKNSAAPPPPPPPPKFSDLIQMASSGRSDDDNSRSPTPAARNKSAISSSIRPAPASEQRRNGIDRRPYSSESRTRPPDHYNRSGNGDIISRSDTRRDNVRDTASRSAQSRGIVSGSSAEMRNSRRPMESGARASTVTSSRLVASSNNTRSGRDNRSADSRNCDTRNGDGQEAEKTSRQREEKRPSAKARKKDEEERLVELRKRRIREEEERVRLRNDVLSGKKSSADLKTLVTKSMGSTVLSCGGRQANPSIAGDMHMPPDRRHRGDDRQMPSESFRRDPYASSYRSNGRPPDDRYYDDYEEDDEEMDSFIDDGEGADFIDDGDVSSHIREIFGYDKRKYADFDDDDIEESSFAQVQKEEMRSAKIGRKEDLEDMKMEQLKKKEKRRLMNRN